MTSEEERIRNNVAIKVAKAIAEDHPMTIESPNMVVHNTELGEAVKQLSPICHSIVLDKIAGEYEWSVHFEYK